MKSTALEAVGSAVTNICCDVAMDKLNLTCPGLSRPGAVAEWEIANNTDRILETLLEIREVATAAGLEKLRMVVEPTGVYHELLLRLARQLGFETSFVDGSHVCKMREIVFGDPGKTDERDPRAIAAVADQGRLIQDRRLPEAYQMLRTWTRLYAEAEEAMITAKCRIHRILKVLFPDFSFGVDFLYGLSGRAIFRCFRFNPHRIVKQNTASMHKRLRRNSRILRCSVERLRAQARESSRSAPAGRIAKLLEYELALAWSDFEQQESRREAARKELERLYDETQEGDSHLPDARRGVVSKCGLARLVGELGPMSDYASWRQLLRMGGLNLCERKSGRYVGQTKTSRKGRPGVRVILNQIALSLVKRDRLFGSYYRRKIVVHRMEGKKAMTAVARKILKMIWGWYQSSAEFDRGRVFLCESMHRRAA